MDQATLNRLRLQDRADLEPLLDVLNGAMNSLKRDECGDPVIEGTHGMVYATDDVFRAYVACRSARHQTAVKKALALFATMIQDGDDQGIVGLDRMPTAAEAAILRDAIGLRQTRPAPARGFARQQAGFPAQDAANVGDGHGDAGEATP